MTQLETKAKREFERHAKESLEVQELGSAIYAFGTELACLRLDRAYRGTEGTSFGYSENLGRWFFSLEKRFTA